MRPLLLPALLAAGLARSQPPTIHVTVALCDNVHQGIVPVPAALGNGQDKDRNLYWGAAYGVRTWFDRSKAWERVKVPTTAPAHVLERCVWRHRATGAVLVADAWDGRYIAEATGAFLDQAGGHAPLTVNDGRADHALGGGADVHAYVGHDGLMDFAAPPVKAPADSALRRTIILACISQRYFREPVRATGASPLLWTTGLMAPEAYTLEAALNTWLAKGDDAAVREAAASAYHTWQKCGLNAARRLLVTGW
ncbi:MAG: hypothetical protein JNL05_02435 [Flavobacteriales bacterium]|nr:hypothetical protein [Flavobacteriales bacterium]